MFQSRCCKYIVLTILACTGLSRAQQPGSRSLKFPYPEKLSYRIEWRLINAGSAVMDITNPAPNQWQTNLEVQSAGIMTRLYKVADTYKVTTDGKFCGINATFDAQEGKRHALTTMSFDNNRHRVRRDERDLVLNTTKHEEADIVPCTHEVMGALTSLRSLTVDGGKSVTLPVTNGRKLANIRAENQAKESIVIDGKTYNTIRLEVYIFDNALYRRRGRLLIWLTDDGDRTPVQFRFQMAFPIGNVSLYLEKQSRH